MKNLYDIDEGRVVIHLSGGKKTEIDTSDLEIASSYEGTWSAVKAKNDYYVVGFINKQPAVFLHRLIKNAPKGFVVDHINQNTLDNRKINLRVVTQAENLQNKSRLYKNNKSGYRGVYWHSKSKKWTARLTVGGKKIHVGEYDDVHQAGEAVAEARKRLMPYSKEAM